MTGKDETLIDGLPKEYYDDVGVAIFVSEFRLRDCLEVLTVECLLRWVLLVFPSS